ncbi:MAG: type II toxin-antitoxin system RelE/ParE family toxin [Bacteroidia bacterium]|nr:type II toxin-antitoxin system RelE/ParE family toxin [Bacteroidia bacterium]
MVEVVWTQKALGQYERAIKYILKEQGKSYAQAVIDKVDERVESVRTFSRIGEREPLLLHKKQEYRYLVAWSYKIIYKVSGEKCTVSRFFHTSQNPEKIFL